MSKLTPQNGQPLMNSIMDYSLTIVNATVCANEKFHAIFREITSAIAKTKTSAKICLLKVFYCIYCLGSLVLN